MNVTLRRADMRSVVVKSRLAPDVYAADERPSFVSDGTEIQAVLQPMSASKHAEPYGERTRERLLLLTRSRICLTDGMGVCVNANGGACDYRIAEPPRVCRGHTRAVIERL